MKSNQRCLIVLIVLLIGQAGKMEANNDLLLAQKFAPILLLHSAKVNGTQYIPQAPESVNIVGADDWRKIWFNVKKPGTKGQSGVEFEISASDWKEKFMGTYSTTDSTGINYSSGSYANLNPEFQVKGSWRNLSYPKDTYQVKAHFDFAGPNINGSDFDRNAPAQGSWERHYKSVRDSFPNTIYAHIFTEDGGSGSGRYVIQYWFFYPYNDWINNHEGDWEHINVIVSSRNPLSAVAQEVEFYFHGQAMSRKAKYGNNGPAKADYLGQLGPPEVPLVGNRPLVYVGGGSLFSSEIVGSTLGGDLVGEPVLSRIIGTLNSDSGLQSGGSYPYRALWFEPQGGILGALTDNYEYPNGLFSEVIDNAEIVLLPNKTDPSVPDWLKANIKWGHLEVPSPAGRENEAPSGPAHKGNWEKTIATKSVASNKIYSRKPQISTIGSNINLYTYQFTPPVISGDQTWSGNITICGDITVLPGTTLTISSGTTINFVQNWDINQSGRLNLDKSELNIKGKLVADGVIFQSEPLQNLSRTNTDWSGIVVSEEGSIDIKDSTIQNSIYEIYLDGPPASATIEAYINEAIIPIQIGGSGPYSLSDAPAGISISDSGSITGTPTQTGTFNMTVTARDAIKNIVTHSLTLRVIQRLVVSPISNVNATQDVAITPPIQVNVSGGQTPYTYSLFGELEFISISDSGSITGTPTEVGTFTVKVKVQDAAHKAVSDSFDISVSSVITPLTLAPISDIIATQNMKIDPIQVKTSGGQRGYAYAIKSDPEAGAGLSISDSGLITGKPTASKDFKVTVTVEDRIDALVDAAFFPTASRSFMMRVRPPVTVSAIDNITIVQNTSMSMQVSASGGQTPYRYSIVSNPAEDFGLTIGSRSGNITGTPTKAGTFTVTVTVTDAHGRTGTRSFSMTVNAPTPVSALTIAEISDITVKISAVQTNSPITLIQVSASGGQTPYAYAITSNPATGSGLTIDSSSGQITGTPTKAGTFTLTVKVTDKVNKTATESFSMAVSLIGDFNGDGVVNLSDHTLFVATYGFSEGDDGYNAEMDLNGDGTINTADFLIFVSHFPNADQFF